jgi:hypothetical protein
VVLAPVDGIQLNAQRLHHRRPGAAQVMRRPRAIFATGQHQGVVVLPVLHRLARPAVLVLLEHRLPIAQLLADRLPLHWAVLQRRREAPGRVPGALVQQLELRQREVGQIGVILVLIELSFSCVTIG